MTPWALLGSGEFEPWSEVADRFLLERATGDGRVVIVPTASSLEEDEIFDRWGDMGLEHFAGLGVEAEVLSVRTRSDAQLDALADRLREASVVYVSGGNPAHLAATIHGTAVFEAIVLGLTRGMGYAGCSAGAAGLTETTFDSDADDLARIFRPGLGLVTRTVFGPHWNMVDSWVPGASTFILSSVPEGYVFIGIDERTAMVGDGASWVVRGTGSVHVRVDGTFTTYADGDTFDFELATADLGA